MAAACLAVPAVAAGQSAGDDQYADPFESQQPQSSPSPQPNSPPSTPSQAPSSSAPAGGSSTSGNGPARQLAYTGVDLPLLFVAGAAMMLAGFTVRRVVAGPYVPR